MPPGICHSARGKEVMLHSHHEGISGRTTWRFKDLEVFCCRKWRCQDSRNDMIRRLCFSWCPCSFCRCTACIRKNLSNMTTAFLKPCKTLHPLGRNLHFFLQSSPTSLVAVLSWANPLVRFRHKTTRSGLLSFMHITMTEVAKTSAKHGGKQQNKNVLLCDLLPMKTFLF